MMTGRRQLPPVEDLVSWRDKGMTLRQMVDRIEEETGERITISAISQALSRKGKTREMPRYDDVIPWRVSVTHGKHLHVRMLRLLGRRQRGLLLDPQQEKSLDRWLADLGRLDAVVTYRRDMEPGFHLVKRRPGIDNGMVRVPRELLEMASN